MSRGTYYVDVIHETKEKGVTSLEVYRLDDGAGRTLAFANAADILQNGLVVNTKHFKVVGVIVDRKGPKGYFL